jgi:hypothetical protein
LKGTTGQNLVGTYGTQGISSPSNYPGSRQYGSMVADQNETVWLSQTQMAELFDSSKQNISLHINNVFK